MTHRPPNIRKLYEQTNILSASEYVSGLELIDHKVNDFQHTLLKAQYYAPFHSVTGLQLAAFAGMNKWSPVINSQYGRLGRMFCEATGYRPDYGWWSTWSLGYSGNKGFVWEMHPEVAKALEILGWVAPSEAKIPEEVVSEEHFVEGAIRRITVNAYERNREARRKCLDIHGTECSVCEIDLEFVYGAVAQGFIHVHHVKPLSEINEEYEVDPESDLLPVCPNCHAIIHLGGKTRSPEEIREMMKSAEAGRDIV